MRLEIISKYPSGNPHPTPLLFVHGALHAAWCWDVHFLEYFAQHGFAHAVNLRGHGNSEGREKLRWHPLIFAKVSLTFRLYPLVATPRLAREAFFSQDLPDEQLLEYWKQMQDDSFGASPTAFHIPSCHTGQTTGGRPERSCRLWSHHLDERFVTTSKGA